jgi:hypothetical protein
MTLLKSLNLESTQIGLQMKREHEEEEHQVSTNTLRWGGGMKRNEPEGFLAGELGRAGYVLQNCRI